MQKKKQLLIEGYSGFGDNIYQRPFVRSAATRHKKVWIRTPFPFMYEDIPNVKCLRPGADMKWRTQLKHVERTKDGWVDDPVFPPSKNTCAQTQPVSWGRVTSEPPAPVETSNENVIQIRFNYSGEDLLKKNIYQTFDSQCALSPGIDMDLPKSVLQMPCPIPVPVGKKLAVLRPATVRSEWPVPSRCPNPVYLKMISEDLRRSGYYVVSIADLEPKKEWLHNDIDVDADLRLYSGELTFPELLSLIKHANVVVGGSGWIVPAAIACKTPLFIVFGGRGAYDAPEKLLDFRMGSFPIGWSLPDQFCRCEYSIHTCNKAISNPLSDFYRFMKTL